ncbi:MAG: hypothetical protein IPK26_10285 [Planctomycetes bacterium]|nr:hypothetical protein [Planctomycetota bacterium]
MNASAPVPDHRTTMIVCSSLLGGVCLFAIVIAVLLQGDGTGMQPLEFMNTLSVAVGASLLPVALLLRSTLRQRAEQKTGADRARARFAAVLVPIAVLEGGMMLGLTTWMMNGTPMPGLVVACVLLAAAIGILPFRAPDEA